MGLIVRALVLLYRVGLHRYPAHFRREYGDEMVACFERALRDAAGEQGFRRLVGRTLQLFGDWVRGMPTLRVQRSGAWSRSDAREGETMKSGRVGQGSMGWGGWWLDLRHAWRGLAREPRFSGLVVGVLGAGIALFVGVLAIVNVYLLRPLPFPDADRIVSVRGTLSAVSWTEVDEVFDRAVSWDLDVFIMTGNEGAELTNGAWVTADFLDMYGVQPALGRNFTMEEVRSEGAQVALIGHAVWQSRFGADPGVVGRTFSAYTSDRPEHAEVFTIVGVLPEDFWYFNEYTDVLVPIREERAVYTARLREGVPIERARDVVESIARANLTTIPDDFAVELIPLQEQHTAALRPRLLLFQSAVALVLLIACANAAVLILVRSRRRERELGVRRALGAGRARLARQLVFEGVGLALVAGAVGAILAGLSLGVLQPAVESQVGQSVPGGAGALAVDGSVLLWTVVVCMAVGVVFGMVPLLGGSVRLLVLIGAGRGTTESRASRRLSRGLVAGEVALAVALLVAAGLLLRSSALLGEQELGFDHSRMERGVVGVRTASYPDPADRVAFYDRLLEEVERLPSVEEAGLVSAAPFSTRFGSVALESDAGTTGDFALVNAHDSYFGTIGARVSRGRTFTSDDGIGQPLVTVVTAATAQRLWPGEDPLGRRLRVVPFRAGDPPGEWQEVVGVLEDMTIQFGASHHGIVFGAFRQTPGSWMNVVARVREGSPSVMPQIRDILRGMDPDTPLSSVMMLSDAVDRAQAPARFAGRVMTVLSLLAAGLAMVGLFGVVSYSARQRRRDVAIRLALGASPASARRPFVRDGMAVVVIGMFVGFGFAAVMGRLLEAQLYGLPPTDPVTHSIVAVVVTLSALLAVWIPSRRATAVDPMGVLREE